MKKRKTLLTVALLAAVALLAVGYAAVTARNLMIKGTASANGDQKNFLVAYDTAVDPTVTQPAHGTVVAAYSEESQYLLLNADNETVGPFAATLTVDGLTTKGDEATATYTVKNFSADINAVLNPDNIKVVVTDAASEMVDISYTGSKDYFDVTAAFANTGNIKLGPGESTTVTVKVKLKTTLIDEKKADITVTFKATPEEVAG